MADAGWYPDPGGSFELRYHDGERWTEHVFNNGAQATSPLNDDMDGLPNPTQQESVVTESNSRDAGWTSRPTRQSGRIWKVGVTALAVLAALAVIGMMVEDGGTGSSPDSGDSAQKTRLERAFEDATGFDATYGHAFCDELDESGLKFIDIDDAYRFALDQAVGEVALSQSERRSFIYHATDKLCQHWG